MFGRSAPALLLLAPLTLGGCAAALVGSGAVVGATAAEERSFGAAIDDALIQTQINERYLSAGFGVFNDLDITVNEGRVVLTGSVDTPEREIEAVRLAWQVDGVRSVDSALRTTATDFLTDVDDTTIATVLRSRLTFDGQVNGFNYTIEVVDGVVYLIGKAASRAELDRVVAIAKTVSGVRDIETFVEVPG